MIIIHIQEIQATNLTGPSYNSPILTIDFTFITKDNGCDCTINAACRTKNNPQLIAQNIIHI